MTLPRSLHLKRSTETGVYTVASRPVKELKSIEGEKIEMKYRARIKEDNNYRIDKGNDLEFQLPYKIKLTFDLANSSATDFGIRLDNPETGDIYQLGFKEGRLYSDRTQSGRIDFEERFAQNIHFASARNISGDNKVQLEVFFDRSSVEIFVNNGEMVMTDTYFPNKGYSRGMIFSDDGELVVEGFTTTSLKTIW